VGLRGGHGELVTMAEAGRSEERSSTSPASPCSRSCTLPDELLVGEGRQEEDYVGPTRQRVVRRER
jgi:hypothetical protein